MSYSFRPHDPPGVCARCGFKFHVSQLQKEWSGARVCRGPGTNDCYDVRNPQDFVRGIRDRQQVPGGAAPEPADVFDTVYDLDALALFARFTTAPSTARKALITNLIIALKAASVWTKFDAFYILAAADSQAAGRNWVADQYNLTEVAGPTFTADREYAGDGISSYLETNFNPTTATSPLFTLNSAHLGIRSRTSGLETSPVIGNTNALFETRDAGDIAIGKINSASQMQPANADGTGGYIVSRPDSGNQFMYKNGAQIATGAHASNSMTNATFRLLGRGGAGGVVAGALSSAHFGAALTAADATAIDAAVAIYMTAVGA